MGKIQVLTLALVAAAACGCSTNVKVQDRGAVRTGRVEKGTPLAPVLMQYQFNIQSDKHVIYFFDEDKIRYDVTVPGDLDTQKGIVFYLPSGKEYAMVSMFIYRNYGEEFLCGDELDLFKLNPDKLNALPRFVLERADDGKFRARHAAVDGLDLAGAAERFGELPPVQPIQVQLFKPFKLR